MFKIKLIMYESKKLNFFKTKLMEIAITLGLGLRH